MSNKEDKEIIRSIEILEEAMNRGFSKIEEKIGKVDGKLESFKLETNIHFNNLELDLRSFKNDTEGNFAELNGKFDDLNETVMNHDKRIEVLEEKVLG